MNSRESLRLSRRTIGRILSVLDAPESGFVALAKLAGLNPRKDFRGADLKGVDFGTDNLAGFDFSGADLSGAELSRAVGLSRVVIDEATRIDGQARSSLLSRLSQDENAWTSLEKAFEKRQSITGRIDLRVKSGFMVDLGGLMALLPDSQVDVRPMREIGALMALMGTPQPFQIIRMDRARRRIVVSRRAALRAALIQTMWEGQILGGVVKNIVNYGAFVDLGGVVGLLHVTDIAWRRINHPSEALQTGQQVKVQVIRLNPHTQRIGLGMKQLEADPWEDVAAKYPVGAKFSGRVTNIVDYGAFVELEPGVVGLLHVSEMFWTKRDLDPGKIVAINQEIEVMILDVDVPKRRISLGLKQVQQNPWEKFAYEHPIGSVVEGEIRNITESGLFVGLSADIDGMVHIHDLPWDEQGELAFNKFEKGQTVQAKVLDVDVEKERISLGIKQLKDDPAASVLARLKKGIVVNCVVTVVQANGIEVRIDDVLTGFIRRSELAYDKNDQRPDLFVVGQIVNAKVIAVNGFTGKLSLSIKRVSAPLLGDILSAAIRRRHAQVNSQAGAQSDDQRVPREPKP